MKIDLTKINTEQQNENSYHIDRQSTAGILKIINNEDQIIARQIALKIQNIENVIDNIFPNFQKNGRLIYIGAGTSGRLGILDASEMLPTFSVEPGKIIGLIAGGKEAIENPIEGAEDDTELALDDLKRINFNKTDAIIGISASGRTPYVIKALSYAREIGAYTAGLCMTTDSEMKTVTKDVIDIITGGEVITGSTRMKSGTATKMVLNMISTTLMVKLGKVYNNLMIDIKATNEKLKERCVNIVKKITKNSDTDLIRNTLIATNYNCAISSLMILKNLDKKEAQKLLQENHNILAKIINL
ncbi:N-acetylmuramic acid 6-phosphate etherase [Spiroplasma endosymbiont of Amphibalanus improvisus]|uniref:N-acetylmuramic acid 6-phosphate etherase n=1 Tax=Spiroplasma endosymbiont of Amphibalanus improvisus TaxID=3066327 RepID=UPI00313EACA0